jgi:ubiquinone/menaquinone biosynthesis C-methylase UbiE
MEDRWEIAYRDKTAIYDALSRAEDATDRVPARLMALGDFAGCEVLEIGPGTGRYTRVLAPHCRRWWALELSAAMLARGRAHCDGIPQLRWIQGDAGCAPLADASADLVFVSWVFSGLPSDAVRDRVDREIARVLRPGGAAWFVENAAGDEFIETVWGRAAYGAGDLTGSICARWGYEPVDVVETAFEFPDATTARDVLGFLLGPHAADHLTRHPKARIGHRVALLRKE